MSNSRLIELLESTWTTQEIARRFGVTSMTIHLWRRRPDPLPVLEIPGHRRPSIRFVPREVQAWAKRNERVMHGAKRPLTASMSVAA
jgi:hypothetical protein